MKRIYISIPIIVLIILLVSVSILFVLLNKDEIPPKVSVIDSPNNIVRTDSLEIKLRAEENKFSENNNINGILTFFTNFFGWHNKINCSLKLRDISMSETLVVDETTIFKVGGLISDDYQIKIECSDHANNINQVFNKLVHVIKPFVVEDVRDMKSTKEIPSTGSIDIKYGMGKGSTGALLGYLNDKNFYVDSGSGNSYSVPDNRRDNSIGISYLFNLPLTYEKQIIEVKTDRGVKNIFLPFAQNKGSWNAYFYVDDSGSTYWANEENSVSSNVTLSPEEALVPEHRARKSEKVENIKFYVPEYKEIDVSKYEVKPLIAKEFDTVHLESNKNAVGLRFAFGTKGWSSNFLGEFGAITSGGNFLHFKDQEGNLIKCWSHNEEDCILSIYMPRQGHMDNGVFHPDPSAKEISKQVIGLDYDESTINIYLPSIPKDSEAIYFYVASDGSTYYRDINHDGTGRNMPPEEALVPKHLARSSGG